MCSLQGKNILGYKIKRGKGILHCPSIKAPVVSGTELGRAAFHCNPVLKVIIGSIPFFLWWDEMVVEGGTTKKSV